MTLSSPTARGAMIQPLMKRYTLEHIYSLAPYAPALILARILNTKLHFREFLIRHPLKLNTGGLKNPVHNSTAPYTAHETLQQPYDANTRPHYTHSHWFPQLNTFPPSKRSDLEKHFLRLAPQSTKRSLRRILRARLTITTIREQHTSIRLVKLVKNRRKNFMYPPGPFTPGNVPYNRRPSRTPH